MTNLVLKLSTLLLSSLAFAATDCQSLDTLFHDGRTYLCKSQQMGPTCVKTGYHKSVKKDGIRIFNENFDFDRMIFHDPVWHRCNLAILKACTHETLKTSKDRIKAYRYKGPDLWDARSNEISFELDIKNGSATMRRKNWSTRGKLRSLTTTDFYDCQEQIVE